MSDPITDLQSVMQSAMKTTTNHNDTQTSEQSMINDSNKNTKALRPLEEKIQSLLAEARQAPMYEKSLASMDNKGQAFLDAINMALSVDPSVASGANINIVDDVSIVLSDDNSEAPLESALESALESVHKTLSDESLAFLDAINKTLSNDKSQAPLDDKASKALSDESQAPVENINKTLSDDKSHIEVDDKISKALSDDKSQTPLEDKISKVVSGNMSAKSLDDEIRKALSHDKSQTEMYDRICKALSNDKSELPLDDKILALLAERRKTNAKTQAFLDNIHKSFTDDRISIALTDDKSTDATENTSKAELAQTDHVSGTSTALSTEVHRQPFCDTTVFWIGCSNILESFLSSMPCWRPLTIQERRKAIFLATDRTVMAFGQKEKNKTAAFAYDSPHEVLELVLPQNHCVGGRISRKYSVVVEIPDREVFIPKRPKSPKSSFQLMVDSINDLIDLLALNDKPCVPEDKDRWEKAEPQAFEMVLSVGGNIKSENLTDQVSLFFRRATREEGLPHPVELHLSQKEWYERWMVWMTKNADKCKEKAKEAKFAQCSNIPKCDLDFEIDDTLLPMLDSDSADSILDFTNNKSKSGKNKKVPGEIALADSARKPKSKPPPPKPMPHRNVWIPDHDVVLGLDTKGQEAATSATRIFQERIIPVYSSKANLREEHINIMKLMLKEELKDEEEFRNQETLPESRFWVKVGDLEEEPRKESKTRPDSTKWLPLPSGDFLGPYFVAHDIDILKAVEAWAKTDPEPTLSTLFKCGEQPKEPESRSRSILESVPSDEERHKKDTRRKSLAAENKSTPVATSLVNPTAVSITGPPLLLQMEGPMETLGEKAKQICKEWVEDSETLLIKAAKKTLIDAFQADFHSFLFLFQVQLRRLRGGDLSGKKNDGFSAVGSDDNSWVSAEPSVEEKGTRVEDIERACVAFMNQMGNDMVKNYILLTGDTALCTSPTPSFPAAMSCGSILSDADHSHVHPGVTDESKAAFKKAMGNFEARQSSPACLRQADNKARRTANNVSFASPKESPEISVLSDTKAARFDPNEANELIQDAVQKAVKQLEVNIEKIYSVDSFQKKAAKAPLPRLKSKSKSRSYDRHDDHDDDDDEKYDTTEESTRSYPSYDVPSYDLSYESHSETSAEEESLPTTRSESYYGNPRSRTFSGYENEGSYRQYDDDDDDDDESNTGTYTYEPTSEPRGRNDSATFDSPVDDRDDFDDDSTYPTVDSGHHDEESVTFSPSEASASFETYEKPRVPIRPETWFPGWFVV